MRKRQDAIAKQALIFIYVMALKKPNSSHFDFAKNFSKNRFEVFLKIRFSHMGTSHAGATINKTQRGLNLKRGFENRQIIFIVSPHVKNAVCLPTTHSGDHRTGRVHLDGLTSVRSLRSIAT